MPTITIPHSGAAADAMQIVAGSFGISGSATWPIPYEVCSTAINYGCCVQESSVIGGFDAYSDEPITDLYNQVIAAFRFNLAGQGIGTITAVTLRLRLKSNAPSNNGRDTKDAQIYYHPFPGWNSGSGDLDSASDWNPQASGLVLAGTIPWASLNPGSDTTVEVALSNLDEIDPNGEAAFYFYVDPGSAPSLEASPLLWNEALFYRTPNPPELDITYTTGSLAGTPPPSGGFGGDVTLRALTPADVDAELQRLRWAEKPIPLVIPEESWETLDVGDVFTLAAPLADLRPLYTAARLIERRWNEEAGVMEGTAQLIHPPDFSSTRLAAARNTPAWPRNTSTDLVGAVSAQGRELTNLLLQGLSTS